MGMDQNGVHQWCLFVYRPVDFVADIFFLSPRGEALHQTLLPNGPWSWTTQNK